MTRLSINVTLQPLLSFPRYVILSDFFRATQVAASALEGDFKLKPYYNAWFHFEAITTFFCHIFRAIYNLAALALRVVATPFLILSFCTWFALPSHLLNLVDNLIGLAISVVTIAIHPVISVLRTLSSMVLGYREGNIFYCCNEEEAEADLDRAMTIF